MERGEPGRSFLCPASIEGGAEDAARGGTTFTPPATAAALAEAAALAARFASKARAASTTKVYERRWADYAGWCAAHGLTALPSSPESVAMYLAARTSRLKPATLEAHLTAIAAMHRVSGLHLDKQDPRLVEVRKGIRRTLGAAQIGKAPLVTADIQAIVSTLPRTLAGLRDKAMILVGFAGALRRSEIVALDVEDLQFTSAGVILWLLGGKTDQERRGQPCAIPRGRLAASCPVRALQSWLAAARIEEGPLFRPIDRFGRMGSGRLDPKSVSLVVKRAVAAYGARQGWSPKRTGQYVAAIASHSLRVGCVTSASAAGLDASAIMRQSRHKRYEDMLRYIRIGTLFRGNAAGKLGL